MKASSKFFEEKRTWSKIKYQVLGSYLPAYIAKVKMKGKPILLIDAFAGPGVFDDGSAGSPLVICQAAEKQAPNKYHAVFVNRKKKHHTKLTSVITKAGWSKNVTTILGDGRELLKALPPKMSNCSTFLYIDPFGITGCEFNLIESILEQPDTELMLTMSMPIVHRLAGRKAVEKNYSNNKYLKMYHTKLTDVFGGEKWKEIMWQPNASPEEREIKLIDYYCSKLRGKLPYVGRCPVREKSGQRIKYFIVFAASHPDAMGLMNDNMINAYSSNMHQADYNGTLWQDLNWREMRDTKGLDQIILNTISKYPGKTRKEIWMAIVEEYFMEFLSSEYRPLVQSLFDKKYIESPTPKPTKRLNDNCELFIVPKF